MIGNYFKIALRSIQKNSLFSSLNILGLSLSLAVSVCLFLLVRYERSFDKMYPNFGQICRVVLNRETEPGTVIQLSTAPNVAGPSAKEGIPAVKQYARLLANNFTGDAFVTAGEKSFTAEKLYWADPGLVEIFDLKALSGDLKTALTEPNSVALCRSAAIRFFGTSDPVGQSLKIDRRTDPLVVRAVYPDFEGNSSVDAEIMGSFITEKWANKQLVWSNASFETWLLLDPAADRHTVESQLTAIYEKNTEPDGRWFTMWLQPLADVHFGSADMQGGISKRAGDPRQVALLSILALAVLLIACFNYMNLSTAEAQTRAREVGISKALGASKGRLVARFYIETAVLVAFSMILALGIVAVGLPFFSRLADRDLHFGTLISPVNVGAFAAIGVVVILLAGSYPALALSSYLPKNLLKSDFGKNSAGGWLRRSLVTTQFAASVILIVATMVLWQQMKFIQQKNLGFEPEQVVAINTTAAERAEQIGGFMDGIRQLSAIQGVCRSQTFPGGSASGRSLMRDQNDQNGLPLNTCRATSGIENVLGLQLLAGAALPDKPAGDTNVHVILTQKGVEYLGFTPENIIGRKVECSLGPNSVVVGVVNDFHSASLHQAIEAYAFHDAETEGRRYVLVKMNTENVPATMAQIEQLYKQQFPGAPFDTRFLDDQIEKLYRTDQRTAQVMSIFCFLSVLVSCLGLFGLAAFAAARRTKEIGIRKVLGASIAGITGLLAKDFLLLVVVAIVIATPVAWYLLNLWLEDFAYRIDLQWWMFAAAGFAAISIAFLTVSFQSVKAALLNPAKSLRSE